MKKGFIKLLLILILPIVAALTNYIIDPANIFNNNKLVKVAKYLAEQKNVANIPNHNERLLQKIYIEIINKCPGTIVLGSSRAMQIHKDLFPKNTFFNHSVSAANIHDFIAIWEIYEEKKKLPKRIILGLDHWILNKNNEDQRWISLRSEFYKMLKKLNLDSIDYKINNSKRKKEKIYELFSTKYFIESIQYWRTGGYYPTKQQKSKFTIKHYDGSLMYNKKRCNMPQNEVDENAVRFASEANVNRMSDFFIIDRELSFLLESFIQYLKASDVEIILFLSPYHPITYKKLAQREDCKIIFDIETYFIELSEKYNLELIGSYNPKKMNLTNKDFYDAVHPKREAINKIFIH